MADGIPYFKSHKTPVENSEESLEDIEKQACLLFEEFLRITEPASSAGRLRHAKSEHSDSPVERSLKKSVGGGKECSESYEEDDMVPDSQIMEKSHPESRTPLPATRVEQPADPTIQKLAHQMQLAGDALTSQYGRHVTGVQSHLVSFVLENAASLTYDRLSQEIDNMVGRDRNWSNFVMAMCLSKRVAEETARACGAVTDYFKRYISQSYSRAMQQAGGMAPFVESRGHRQ